MNTDINDLPDWAKKMVQNKKNEPDKNKFVEWGKLGGRPQKENKKSERITLRFTPDEMKFLMQESERKNISLTDYSRIILLNKTIPNKENNLQLIEYANNFSRLSNFIKSGISKPFPL